MNKLKLLVTILTIGTFSLLPFLNTSAQTAKIKTMPISPRLLTSTIVGTYPAGSNPVYSGNHTVAVGMPIYLTADTAGGVNQFTWSFDAVPTGSNAAFNSTSDQTVKFTPDIVGWYAVNLSVNGGASTDVDSFYVDTYLGPDINTDCETCHPATMKKYSSWKLTPHANVFKEGITGQLETTNVNNQLVGAYAPHCFKCHTTGWDQNVDNGNFGYLAHQDGFDTTWYKTYTLSGGDYLIPTNDQTAWNLLVSETDNLVNLGTIGCESCHGPVTKHATGGYDATGQYVSATLNAGVCLQCHDAPTHYTIGTYYVTSAHYKFTNGEHTARTSCYPCHSGAAYVKYLKNPTNPGYTADDGDVNISCAVCHDPHDGTNFGLRIMSNITLLNGYAVTAGGNGQLCMRCHQARIVGNTQITDVAPYYGWKQHFEPMAPQADMLFGQNAYEFGDTTLAGLNTHGSVPNACVTCHMANIGTGNSPSHQFGMVDTTGGTPHDLVGGCVNCHGPITSFDDIKAASDWDGNGKIEGVQTEVRGMMDTLAAYLPKDANGVVLTSLSNAADSMAIANRPEIVKGIYTYNFVSYDGSYGVHNAKYTVKILQDALANLGVTVPVELTSFQAAASNGKVTLNWQTATETNNKGFEVEKKYGNSWTSVGFVNGKGNSTQMNSYSYVDNISNAGNGTISYRLKQIDLNGTYHYSKVVEVSVVTGPKEYTLSQNYPNPFNPSTTIQYALPFDSHVKIVVYNITGAVVKVLSNSLQNSGVHSLLFNTETSGLSMSSGVYFYSIEATSIDGSRSFRETKKMVLLK
jgi:hypothetical protein